MTHEQWFISDTHFFHSNILKFTDGAGKKIRPFNSLEEMHETIIENWNNCVKDNDIVNHLGDVTFRYDDAFNNLMSRLKGKKRLIVGNHDKIWNPTLMRWFEKATLWKVFPEKNFTAVHIPLELHRLRDGAFCVHGHTHQNVEPNPGYVNVCVEKTNYTPVHIDEINLHLNT